LNPERKILFPKDSDDVVYSQGGWAVIYHRDYREYRSASWTASPSPIVATNMLNLNWFWFK